MWEVALYVRESFNFAQLSAGDDKVKSLWVRIKGKSKKTDVLVEICLQTTHPGCRGK